MVCLAPLLLWFMLALAGAPSAQQEGTVTLEVRVTSSGLGAAWIDRGVTDGVAKGDPVLFRPREGGVYQGTVIEVQERASRVSLQDPAFVPAPGTRAEIQLPRGRVATPPRPRKRAAPKREPVPEPEAPVTWQHRDDDWAPGQPLLAKVRPLRPEQRPRSFEGRTYAILDYASSSEDDRTDGFYRLGSSALFDNVFGHGDQLLVDVELNYRNVDVPDLDDEDGTELRVDRLSYGRGGNRFDQARWEFGRFLQSGLPEFGVLDGVEWNRRLPNGNRVGLSVGYMPEPDKDFETGSDFQIAGNWRWVQDETEELSAAVGYQKTFHNGNADRDLVVTSLERLPREGWTWLGRFWVDLYTSGDDAKGSGLGLTQAYVSTGRRWRSGSSLDVVYTHLEFPEIDRHEFLPVTEDQLDDDHAERLSLRNALQLTDETRVLTGVGGWVDEDDEGGDAEIGISLDGFPGERGTLDLVAFATQGRFTRTVGGRAGIGQRDETGFWGLDYEFGGHRLIGFSSANDDLPQHKVRLHKDWFDLWRWSVSARLEGVLYDDEHAVLVGFYIERSY